MNKFEPGQLIRVCKPFEYSHKYRSAYASGVMTVSDDVFLVIGWSLADQHHPLFHTGVTYCTLLDNQGNTLLVTGSDERLRNSSFYSKYGKYPGKDEIVEELSPCVDVLGSP